MNKQLALPEISTTVRTNEPFGLYATRKLLSMAYQINAPLAERWLAKRFLKPVRHAWPTAEQAWLARAKVEYLYTQDLPVDSWNGKRMAVYRWGKADKGRVVVMHGWSGRATQFYKLINALVLDGYEVIGIDAPGHGNSEGHTSSILHFYVAVDRLIRNYGPAKAVVAHSLGGTATLFALEQGLATQRVVLIGANGDATFFTKHLSTLLGLGAEQLASFRRRIETQLGITWDELSVLKRGKSIAQPTLVIHDENDREIPLNNGADIAEALPHAQFEATQGLGHRRILTDDTVIRKIVSFLA